MITIKILGTGCANCKKLEAITRTIVDQMHIEAQFEKVTDIAQIMAWNIMSTPGLVINDTLVSAGRIPSPQEIRAWLQA